METKPDNNKRQNILIPVIISAIFSFLITFSLYTLKYSDKGEEELKRKVNKVDYNIGYINIRSELDKKVDKEVFQARMENIDIFIANQLIIQKDIKDMLKERK